MPLPYGNGYSEKQFLVDDWNDHQHLNKFKNTPTKLNSKGYKKYKPTWAI
jgi:hypothetical protein